MIMRVIYFMDPVITRESKMINQGRIATGSLRQMSYWLNPAAYMLLGYAVLAILVFWVDFRCFEPVWRSY